MLKNYGPITRLDDAFSILYKEVLTRKECIDYWNSQFPDCPRRIKNPDIDNLKNLISTTKIIFNPEKVAQGDSGVASTPVGGDTIYVSAVILNNYQPKQIAAILLHEWVHQAGIKEHGSPEFINAMKACFGYEVWLP